MLEPLNVDIGFYYVNIELKDNHVPPAVTQTSL